MLVMLIGLFLATFQVACDAAPRASFPVLPAEIRFDWMGRYLVEKRQGEIRYVFKVWWWPCPATFIFCFSRHHGSFSLKGETAASVD